MLTTTEMLEDTSQLLSRTFLQNYPLKASRYLETFKPEDAAIILQNQPIYVVVGLWRFIPMGMAESIYQHFDMPYAKSLIEHLDSHLAANLVCRINSEQKDALFMLISDDLVKELEELLVYPEDTAARIMSTHLNVFYQDLNIKDALIALKSRDFGSQDLLYVLDDTQTLVGEVDLADLVKARPDAKLSTILKPINNTLSALDHKDIVVEKFEGYRTNAIPVLDAHQQLIGSVRFFDVYQKTKEDLASDMQTMVGVSKDERALSSGWFAFTKRLPWLQINLLTAFAAAAVVGAFEGLISEITALAILLPVAAGQSGNAGAQALAVTMRGLILREITTRHWRKVLFKEMLAGFLNGLAVAVTCSICVYLWSQSIGLALVIALAMISSLVIAGSAGAIVPIVLKKFGMDPAQSSSIVLTTITDIAGFMSFLGIALLLSDMLPRS